MSTLQSRLSEVQKLKASSVRAFAEEIGCVQGTVMQQIKGLRSVSIDTVIAVLNSFDDISPDWLLLGKGDMYRKPEGTSYNFTKNNLGNSNVVAVGGSSITAGADTQELQRLREENRTLRERCDKLTDKLLNAL